MSKNYSNNILDAIDRSSSSIFGDVENSNSSDDDSNPNDSTWRPANNLDEKGPSPSIQIPNTIEKPKILQFEKRRGEGEFDLVKNPQLSGVELSLSYKRVRIKLQFSRDIYQQDHARVIPYTNLSSPEYKTAQVKPSIQQDLQRSMKKGALEVTSCMFVDGALKTQEKQQQILFTRVPEWGMDNNREMFYISIQNTLHRCCAIGIKRVCFPSIIDNLAPLHDNTELFMAAIFDFIDKIEPSSNPLQSIIVRIGEKKHFQMFTEVFRQKIQQLCRKK